MYTYIYHGRTPELMFNVQVYITFHKRQCWGDVLCNVTQSQDTISKLNGAKSDQTICYMAVKHANLSQTSLARLTASKENIS